MTSPWWLDRTETCFTWDLWYSCNYRCPYCWWEMDGLWDRLAGQNRILKPAEWKRVWDGVADSCGPLRLDILGGEPLLYPESGDVLRSLSERHKIVVSTNLSIEPAELGDMDPGRVHFNASFHPEFSRLDEFLPKVLGLKARGFEPGVVLVAWPPFLGRVDGYRRSFVSQGIPFSLMVFQGRYAGKEYPESYTPRERAILSDCIRDEGERSFRVGRSSTRGRPCHAGRVYANVKGDGTVYRCGQDAFSRKPLGNILDPGFKLHPSARPCPYEHCSCQEYEYLEEVMRACTHPAGS